MTELMQRIDELRELAEEAINDRRYCARFSAFGDVPGEACEMHTNKVKDIERTIERLLRQHWETLP